MEDNASSEKI